MRIRMLKPTTLSEAYALAQLQEVTVAALQNKPRPLSKSSYIPSTDSYNKPLTTPLGS